MDLIKRLYVRYTIDCICWLGASSLLAYYGWNIASALVGATGGVYLYRATQSLLLLRRNLKFFDEMERELDENNR